MLKLAPVPKFSINFLLCTLSSLLTLALVPTPAGAAGPERAARRAGEIIVRFRPGAAPLAGAAAPGTASAPATAAPTRFIPKSNFSNPGRPESLKQLDARFGVRDGRPLAAAVGGASERSARRRAQGRSGSRRAAPASLAGVWLLRLDPAANLDEALAAYRKDPSVLYAEPNLEGALCYVPADPLYAQTKTDFKMIGLEQAWDVRRGASSAVEVAVIDSGVDAQHPDLKGALDLANSYNFVEHSTAIYDDIGHGTRVAGVIGAVAGNGEGIAGVAFGCKLMALDVVSSSGTLTVADVAAAVDWAVARGADVINLSLGFHAFSQTLDEACRGAVESGVAVIAAAGNENQGEQPVYPACTEGVIGVGAVAESGARCPWSNYNGTCRSLVDLVAPGETIFSTIPNGQYNGTFGSGTSFAVPMVSGVAGLLMAKYPAQSGGAITQHLLATAAPVGAAFQPADGAGAGLLDAARALNTAMQPLFSVDTVEIDDSPAYAAANNGDGLLQKGETVRLRVTLKNNQADATNVTATLDTTDTLVTLHDKNGTWGNIPCGQSLAPTDDFSSVDLSAASPAHTISFRLTITASGGFQQTLNFQVHSENSSTPPTIITSNTTWTPDSTYIISSHTLVMPTAKLTIQPGTTVRFGSQGKLEIRGNLDAQGTSGNEITFTSLSGRPQGKHGAPITIPYLCYDQRRVAYGDVDNDGQKEYLDAFTDQKQLTLFRWNGTTLAPESTMSLTYKPEGLAIGDGDNDGQNELYVCDTYENQILIYRWQNGTLNVTGNIATPQPYIVKIVDLDGDGKNELLINSWQQMSPLGGSRLSVARFSGGTFMSPQTLTSNNSWCLDLQFADADDDGRKEILGLYILNSDGVSPGSLIIWRWNANNTLQELARTAVGAYSSTCNYLRVGDADNDGRNEIVTSDSSGFNIRRLENGTLKNVSAINVNNPSWAAIEITDINHDGKNELVLGRGLNNTAYISINAWDGSKYAEQYQLTTGIALYVRFITDDFTQDGIDDLLAVSAGSAYLFPWLPDAMDGPAYPGLWLTSSAASSKLTHCNFMLAPVLDESASTQFTDCLFERAGGDYALCSLNGTLPIVRCTARNNTNGHGIVAGAKPLTGCLAENNRGIGLQGGIMTDCQASGNGSIGISSYRSGPFDWNTLLPSGNAADAQAINCSANNNGRTGIDVKIKALSCTATHNGGRGIDAQEATACTAAENAADGISGLTVSNCIARMNGGKGFKTWVYQPTSTVSMVDHSQALENADWGIDVAGQIVSSVAFGNGNGGMRSAGQMSRSQAAQNHGTGLDAQSTVESCVTIHNDAHGVTRAPGGVRQSWLVGNQQYGYQSLNGTYDPSAARGVLENCLLAENKGPGVSDYASLRDSTIRDNLGAGVQSAYAMNGCNIYGNGGSKGYDYLEKRLSQTQLQVDLSGNYWGPVTTPLMNAHPWQTYFNIPAIYDFLDNTNLCEVKYDPHLNGISLTAKPDDSAPGFLLAVSPDAKHPINIGPAVFRLTFSRAMNQTRPLSVTFGQAAPYTTYVVAPAPGWVDATTWQGSFAVQSDTAEGTCTLRVAGAVDATGFAIPDDTAHQFTVETSGGLSANNGLAIGLGTKMTVQWETTGQPATTLGYNILRSATGAPGSYTRINAAPVFIPLYQDNGLKPNTVYFYIIYSVDESMNASQWTPPFFANTGPWHNAVAAWRDYE